MRKLISISMLLVSGITTINAQSYDRYSRKSTQQEQQGFNQAIKMQSITLNDNTTYIRTADKMGLFDNTDNVWLEALQRKREENFNNDIKNRQIYESQRRYDNNGNYIDKETPFMKNIRSVHEICESIKNGN
jgi:hypothetical protein